MNLSPLFTPYAVGDLVIPNRFVMAPMQRFTPKDLIPEPEFIEDYRLRAKGGIGLVITQGTTMDHWTTQAPYARFYPPAYDAWRTCVDAVRGEGSQIFLQLIHEGASREGGYGPSGITAIGEKRGHAMPREMIPEIVELFAHSAYMAQKLGFSGVELHGAHGGLIDQFFYTGSNIRDDEYGGDLAGRMRFGLEIIRAVRAAVGSRFPISMRISQWKSTSYSAKPFTTPEALREFVLPLKEAGLDILHASTRRFWQPEFEGSDLGYAGWVKRLTGMPVIGVGSVGLNIDFNNSFAGETAKSTGEQGLAELLRRFERGDFDLIAVGRSVLADAEWVNKVKDGRLDALLAYVTTAQVKGDLVIKNYKLPDEEKKAAAG